ncbi:hypothetical protein N7520_006014 [Penicillium odoratum]|uniref:uncharacterized protein n=1 Tax=Penicillium odoratum TaxID=1167516 RepID=UPI0025477D22|nr:uncharacterized protein N7520_006014 [Penicillium odoratum]KAJ5758858.1 hypothetical protein N7520_006014 [Penicillium odoratum]
MSLYFDAVNILTEPASGGSFKSRIYSARDLRAKPAQIYALIIEAAKWDTVLADVIDRSGLLDAERKLSPLLALLLVHDHLIAKNGIAAPAAHTIRQAVERHKVRLRAEFVKARVRRGCASVEQFKAAILREKREAAGPNDFIYPRWVRVNNIRSSLEDQMRTTFASYRHVDSLAELAPEGDDRKSQHLLYVDPNIPDLVAVPYGADFTSSTAYKNGEIILQDKASCFPAYLLLGDRGPKDPWQGDLVDGCAAPGNKTTHMASLLAKQQIKDQKPQKQIICMDASRVRSKTLQKMVSMAGADPTVTVLQGQDFLALDPMDERFEKVTGLLLDPSCSGSGIIGRDDVPQLTLPKPAASKAPNPKGQGKKRKRPDEKEEVEVQQSQAKPTALNTSPSDENDIPSGAVDQERLIKLSNLQARIVEHALSFPTATHVSYSTCSIHLIENEAVVERVLASDIAKEGGWRLLRRDEQPSGLRKWKHRGVREDRKSENDTDDVTPATVDLSDEDLEACLRCWSGDAEGLGGFFVAGFVRDPKLVSNTKAPTSRKKSKKEPKEEPKKEPSKRQKVVAQEEEEVKDEDDDDDWDGFSD